MVTMMYDISTRSSTEAASKRSAAARRALSEEPTRLIVTLGRREDLNETVVTRSRESHRSRITLATLKTVAIVESDKSFVLT